MAGENNKYHIAEMKVGDTRFFEGKTAREMNSVAAYWRKTHEWSFNMRNIIRDGKKGAWVKRVK